MDFYHQKLLKYIPQKIDISLENYQKLFICNKCENKLDRDIYFDCYYLLL